jgi:hypothetical protein
MIITRLKYDDEYRLTSIVLERKATFQPLRGMDAEICLIYIERRSLIAIHLKFDDYRGMMIDFL